MLDKAIQGWRYLLEYRKVFEEYWLQQTNAKTLKLIKKKWHLYE